MAEGKPPPRRFGQLSSSRPPPALNTVPSKRPSKIPAFNPGNIPALQRTAPTKSQPISGDPLGGGGGRIAPRQASFTRAVFDSRPPNAYDWYFNDKWANVPEGSGFELPYPASILGGFTVPAGYIAIIRELEFSIFETPDLIDGQLSVPVEVTGDNTFNTTAEVVMLRMLVDGVPTPYWTPSIPGVRGVPIWEAFFAEVRIPMFIPVDTGQTVTAQIAVPSIWDDGVLFNIYAAYHGNLLPETGRILTAEYGNDRPAPVIETEDGG
jgi:hypothetical protein